MTGIASAEGTRGGGDAVATQRNWVLAGLGAIVALAIQQLVAAQESGDVWQLRMIVSLSVFLGVAALSFALAWQAGRLIGAIAIAVVCGLISSSVTLWSGMLDDGYSAGVWQVFCAGIASLAVLTLYQAAQDGAMTRTVPPRPSGYAPGAIWRWSREAIHYEDVHGHLWTNALLICASLLFMLLSYGIAHLLAAMFMLVELKFLQEALSEEPVIALLMGGAFGAAVGLLRDRVAIIATLQRVIMLVLRVLAPVLALGIGVFLAALPVTGLAPLWETGGTTPIMLVGAIFALLLANAVVGDTAQDESRSVILAGSAAALGVFLLPLVGIAVYSSGLRIHQHGLSSERLWALAFLIVGSITAVGYFVSIIGARGWFARLRQTNLVLVYLVAGIALLLSTPIFGFDRIATQHQLSRLASGQVSAEDFDYRALWFDFGPPGRAAINRLASSSPDEAIRRLASEAKQLSNRWAEPASALAARAGRPLENRLTVLPAGGGIPADLRRRLVEYDACGARGDCLVHYAPADDAAIIVTLAAPDCRGCSNSVRLLSREKGVWSDGAQYLAEGDAALAMAAQIRAGQVDVRPVSRRQIFIGDQPVGTPLPLKGDAAEAIDVP